MSICIFLTPYILLCSNDELQRLTVEDLESAERAIIRAVQVKPFRKEITTLKNIKQGNTDSESRLFARQRKSSMKTCSSFYKLNPFVDVDGISRVGGRLRRSTLADDIKFPIILRETVTLPSSSRDIFTNATVINGKG